MKRCLFFCLLYISVQGAFSQELASRRTTNVQKENAKKEDLVIGEIVPDLELGSIINYFRSSVKLSDFNGKLIILDFWSHSCGACIAAFPKMDSLQKKFGSQIQIIAVNRETTDSTKRLFKRIKRFNITSIPFVTNDTALEKLFPYHYTPHHVWIDGNRKVRYITDGWNANEVNINKYLNDELLLLPEKKDFEKKIFTTPLKDELISNTEFYSLITHYRPNIDVGNRTTSTMGNSGHPNRITRKAASIFELLQEAYGERGNFDSFAEGLLELKNIDSAVFFRPSVDYKLGDWFENNCYDYDLMVPPNKADQLYKFMQQDLTRFFNLNVKRKKKNIECIVLKKLNQGQAYNSKEKTQYLANVDQDSLVRIKAKSMRVFLDYIRQSFRLNKIEHPIIDETGYSGKVEIVLKKDWLSPSNFPFLIAELKKQNLVIEKSRREVIVIQLEANIEKADNR